MRVAVVSLLLLLPMAAAVPFSGNERQVSDEPIEITEAAAGDGFVVWGDSRRGVSDVYIRPRGDDVFRLTLSDPNRESNFGPAADGHWIAWVRFAEATPDPTSESGGQWSREYVVYDVDRQAKVYESGTAGRHEDHLKVAGDRLGFLGTPEDGPAVFHVTRLTGRDAFVEEVPRDTGPHSQPDLSTSHAAFLELQGEQWVVVAVDLETMESRVVADDPGVGYLDPTLDGSRLAWIEFRDGTPTIRIVDLDGDEDRTLTLPAPEVHRVALQDDLLVVEARNGTRFLTARCLDEEAWTPLPGYNPVRSFPVLTPWDSVLYSSSLQGAPYLWEMPLSCDPLGSTADDEASPFPTAWLIVGLLVASRRVPLHVRRRMRR